MLASTPPLRSGTAVGLRSSTRTETLRIFGEDKILNNGLEEKTFLTPELRSRAVSPLSELEASPEVLIGTKFLGARSKHCTNF